MSRVAVHMLVDGDGVGDAGADPKSRTTIDAAGSAGNVTNYHKVWTGDGANVYLQADWTITSSGANTFTVYSSGHGDPDPTAAAITAQDWTQETGVTFTGAAGSAGSTSVHIPNWCADWLLIKATCTTDTVLYRIYCCNKK